MDTRSFIILFLSSLFVILLILSRQFLSKTIKVIFGNKKELVTDHSYIKSLINRLNKTDKSENKASPENYSLELAEKYLKANQFEKAEEYFLAASKNDQISSSPKILRYLAKSSFSDNNFKKAIDYYSKLEAFDHLETNELFEISIAHLSENNFKQTENYLSRALKLDPNNQDYINNFLDTCLSSGKFNNLLEIISEIAEISSNKAILKKVMLIMETIKDKSLLEKINKKINNLSK